MSPTARIGISGWRYPAWRGDFYPRGLAQRRELAYVAERLDSVEINGSFYSLQRPGSYLSWAAEVPEGFVFSVKGGRYITHMLRLTNAHTALANFFASGPLALGEKLGPVLWQLPERVSFDESILDAFLALLPRTTRQAAALGRRHDEKLKAEPWLTVHGDAPIRHALEVRHPSFAEQPAAIELLRRHGVALVVADTAGRWPLLREVTADFVYVRLHGESELYASGYTDESIEAWATDARGWLDGTGCPDGVGRDVYVYFDNDARGHAPFDAVRLRERLRNTPATRAQ